MICYELDFISVDLAEITFAPCLILKGQQEKLLTLTPVQVLNSVITGSMMIKPRKLSEMWPFVH